MQGIFDNLCNAYESKFQWFSSEVRRLLKEVYFRGLPS